MAVVKAFVAFSSLSENSNLRLCYSNEKPQTTHTLIKLFDCLESFETGSRPSGGIIYLDKDEDCALSLGGEQINADGSVDLKKMPLIPIDYFYTATRGKVQQNDILVCKDGALTGKSCYVSNNFPIKEVMVNEHVYILRGNGKINQKILFYLIQSQYVQAQIKDLAYRKKGQPGLNTDHLSKIKIPTFDQPFQKKLLGSVLLLEQKILELKESKLQIEQIINKVFTELLCFDWSEFKKIKSQKRFNATLVDFSKNVDCRLSYKFHNPAGQFIYDFLCSKTKKRIKNFILEPIVLGKSVSPSDYDDEGEFYYIAMSNIKTWAFGPEDCKKVSENYSSSNPNKTVKKDDILLARSGEGTIGKVALIEDEDIQGIFADFTQRIRLKNYNPRLAYYYFRSDFFQYLVYTHKKGLGNNTNIFPSQIQEFPIPDWSEEKQAEIVEKIQTQIDAQSLIDREIEKNTAKINLIIEEAIRNPAYV